MTTISTWKGSHANENYNDNSNWNASVPISGVTGEFEASNQTNISNAQGIADGCLFNPGATLYNFEIAAAAAVRWSRSATGR